MGDPGNFRLQVALGRRGRSLFVAAICAALGLTAVACNVTPGATIPPEQTASQNVGTAGFLLSSDRLEAGEAIPTRFTCDGENVSPRLSWSGAPDGTIVFALIMDDPDAPSGVFTHWVLFNLPANVHSLPEGVPNVERLDSAAVQGRNDARGMGYSGPCPPSGRPHHYRFVLYALNAKLELQPGATKQQVLDAMQGHILGQAQLLGMYQKGMR